jgi:hypothetical protein
MMGMKILSFHRNDMKMSLNQIKNNCSICFNAENIDIIWSNSEPETK